VDPGLLRPPAGECPARASDKAPLSEFAGAWGSRARTSTTTSSIKHHRRARLAREAPNVRSAPAGRSRDAAGQRHVPSGLGRLRSATPSAIPATPCPAWPAMRCPTLIPQGAGAFRCPSETVRGTSRASAARRRASQASSRAAGRATSDAYEAAQAAVGLETGSQPGGYDRIALLHLIRRSAGIPVPRRPRTPSWGGFLGYLPQQVRP
jgi:hypothetical protein